MSSNWGRVLYVGSAVLCGLVLGTLSAVMWPRLGANAELRSTTCPEYKGAVISLSVTHLDKQYVKCAYVQSAVAPPKAVTRVTAGP